MLVGVVEVALIATVVVGHDGHRVTAGFDRTPGYGNDDVVVFSHRLDVAVPEAPDA